MKPDFSDLFYQNHALWLCDSYKHWTGKELLPDYKNIDKLAEALFHAPFALVSHGTEDIPVFNFGNKIALELFELDWNEFIRLPSKESADLENQEDRAKLMARVNTNGFEENCKGIRISSTGKRFLIEGATVWNVFDANNTPCGQAAKFNKWSCL